VSLLTGEGGAVVVRGVGVLVVGLGELGCDGAMGANVGAVPTGATIVGQVNRMLRMASRSAGCAATTGPTNSAGSLVDVALTFPREGIREPARYPRELRGSLP